MNNRQIKNKILEIIENGYSETGIGYHAEYRWNNAAMDWRRGCYAHVAQPYGGSYTIYAPSWRELLAEFEDDEPAEGAIRCSDQKGIEVFTRGCWEAASDEVVRAYYKQRVATRHLRVAESELNELLDAARLAKYDDDDDEPPRLGEMHRRTRLDTPIYFNISDGYGDFLPTTLSDYREMNPGGVFETSWIGGEYVIVQREESGEFDIVAVGFDDSNDEDAFDRAGLTDDDRKFVREALIQEGR